MEAELLHADIERAATAIREADFILIAAGAGMGVDSGLPDYRGPQGFWKAHPVIKEMGLNFEQTCTPQWFHDDPQFAWGYWTSCNKLFTNAVPHEGYTILKKWIDSLNKDHFVFTSNVDGHFFRVGFSSDRVDEYHGSIHHVQCCLPNHCTEDVWHVSDFKLPEVDMTTYKAQGELPKCQKCQRIARHNVLMFGDLGFSKQREAAQVENYHKWLKTIDKTSAKLVVIEIGAGKAVPTVQMNSDWIVKQWKQSTLIRVNPSAEDCQVSQPQHIALRMGGRPALVAIDNILNASKNSES
jgi:NAD-dependent SIR2 family protein deacetylase